MRLKIIFVSLLLTITGVCFAQGKDKFRFTSSNQIGTLSGESSTEFQMQTINGVRYKTITAGVGLGLDFYYEQTIPLFIDLRKTVFDKASTPFIYADAGYSFLTRGSKPEYEMGRKGGIYYAIGIGYELPLQGKVKLVLDGGYSYKHFSRVIDNEPWRSSLHSFDTYEYSFNRISIKAGLGF
jgi:hypothetical protein